MMKKKKKKEPKRKRDDEKKTINYEFFIEKKTKNTNKILFKNLLEAKKNIELKTLLENNMKNNNNILENCDFVQSFYNYYLGNIKNFFIIFSNNAKYEIQKNLLNEKDQILKFSFINLEKKNSNFIIIKTKTICF
jgi:hypothetical protein